MISFGPTIVAPHSTKETLYASTVGICAKALNHILAHINELNEDK
jgi:di/tripeptidase